MARTRDELSITGRVSRRGFWLRHVTLVPLASWLCAASGQVPGAPWDLPFALLATLLLVSIWGRRLHDRGRSAWWLLGVAVPVLGALWLMVECALRGSSSLANHYGSAPGLRADYLTVQTSPKAVQG